MFNIGPTEMLLILLLALIVFGPKRLPEVGRTVGKGLREFRRASQEIKDEIQMDLDVPDEQAKPAAATGSSPAQPSSGADSAAGDGAAPTSGSGATSTTGDAPRADGATADA